MRKWFAASAVVVLIGGSATYAVVGKFGSEDTVKSSTIEAPRIERANLFVASPHIPPAPARDEIAERLAPQRTPVAWPEVKAPKPAKGDAAAKAKKPTQAQKKKQKPRSVAEIHQPST